MLPYVRGELPIMVHADEVRVLVVDDEDAISDLVATTLRYEGFDVEVAASGRGAISAVSSYRPTVLLGTPTFVSYILERARPEELTSLRMIIVGSLTS